jgi:hypothetical protein
VRQVGDVLSASPHYETFSRVTAFMMQAAGPAGRDFMLKLDPSKLDPQSREYLSKIHSAIQAMSFETIRGPLASFPGDKKLADPEVKLRIDAMIANYGKDDRTSPPGDSRFRTRPGFSHCITTKGAISLALSTLRRSTQ